MMSRGKRWYEKHVFLYLIFTVIFVCQFAFSYDDFNIYLLTINRSWSVKTSRLRKNGDFFFL